MTFSRVAFPGRRRGCAAPVWNGCSAFGGNPDGSGAWPNCPGLFFGSFGSRPPLPGNDDPTVPPVPFGRSFPRRPRRSVDLDAARPPLPLGRARALVLSPSFPGAIGTKAPLCRSLVRRAPPRVFGRGRVPSNLVRRFAAPGSRRFRRHFAALLHGQNHRRPTTLVPPSPSGRRRGPPGFSS